MTSPARATRGGRILARVERMGNRLPEPFTLFLGLFGLVALVSSGMAWAGVTVRVPGTEEVLHVRGLLTAEGLTWLTENLGRNYVEFPPLATVLPILLGVGVAERSGLLSGAIRVLFASAPRWALPYAVGLVGVAGSVMADAAFVVIPPLAAMVFRAAGRHPVAGLLGAFAAVGAGYSTSVFVTSLDALFAGITSAVTEVLPEAGARVTPVSNWYLNAVSAVILGLLAGLLIEKVLEPRLLRQGVPTRPVARAAPPGAATSLDQEEVSLTLGERERRALRGAGSAFALTVVALAVAVTASGSPWRNPEGGYLPESPLLSSIVFFVFVLFLVPGLVYGLLSGTVRRIEDVPRMFGEALRDMLGFLVVIFVVAQFIALFSWSGMGSWIAVAGASRLEAIGLTGYGAVLGFVLLAALLNLVIVSGSAQWTLMAAVFVPMFALIGFEPGFTQAAFRIGDSSTQVITPLNPYMIMVVTFLRRWEPEAGIGTVIARMFPFTAVFLLAWLAILTVFFVLDLPVGPGNGIRLAT